MHIINFNISYIYQGMYRNKTACCLILLNVRTPNKTVHNFNMFVDFIFRWMASVARRPTCPPLWRDEGVVSILNFPNYQK